MSKRKPTYLMVKRDEYWFQRRTPADLADTLGAVITRPLNTKNKREAERMARAYSAQLETAFGMLKAGLVEEDDPRAWVRQFGDNALATLHALTVESLAESLSSDDVEMTAEGYAELYMVLVEDVHEGKLDAMVQAVQAVGIDPDTIPASQLKAKAVEAMRALRDYNPAEAVKARKSSTASPPVAQVAPDFADAIQAQLADLAAKVDAQGKAKDAKTFGEALELYAPIKAQMRGKGETVDEIVTMALYVEPLEFARHVGLDKPLDEVRADDVTTWLGTLQDRRSRTPKPIGTGTKNKMVGSLNTFFGVAVKRGWCLTNPAEGLRKARKSKAHERRQAFTAEELQRIFTPKLRAEVERGYAERWWIPCIHLMNGTRTNEAAQLKLRDFIEVGDIPCLRIMPEDETQSTKTEESDRIVPVHPQLWNDLGLREYVERRLAEANGNLDALLCPNLTYLKRKGYKSKVVNHFKGPDGYLARVGVWVKDKKVLYSLRHSFGTACDRANVAKTARQQLMGHARQSDDQGELTYIDNRQARELLTELEKVDWAPAFANLMED